MPSPSYVALQARINELSLKFVNFTIPTTRGPDPGELDNIAAFKLLVHAEFEAFIESRIQETIIQSVNLWKGSKRITKALFGLTLKWYPWFEKDKNPLSLNCKIDEITKFIEENQSKALKEITQNNGVKEAAFTNLSYSAGVFVDELPTALLASLDSYGRARGEVAHNPVGKVRSLNDPRDEANTAVQIVNLLAGFDDALLQALL